MHTYIHTYMDVHILHVLQYICMRLSLAISLSVHWENKIIVCALLALHAFTRLSSRDKVLQCMVKCDIREFDMKRE